MLEDDIKLLATLHISSGSFPLKVKSDRSGVVEIFGKSVQVFLEKNKLKVSDKIKTWQLLKESSLWTQNPVKRLIT